jgi:hypothetical protein
MTKTVILQRALLTNKAVEGQNLLEKENSGRSVFMIIVPAADHPNQTGTTRLS